MTRIGMLLLVSCLMFGEGLAQKTPAPSNMSPAEKAAWAQHRKQWQLVWSDEFTGTGGPDELLWNYQVGGHGWGNKELQFYTERRPENCRLENGRLIIEARKEPWEKNAYTSARITSKRKAELTYGRWEVKARFTGGRGAWPAIWLMPSYTPYGNNGWPDNGEIDIMEHVGWKPGVIHGTIHTKAYNHVINTQKFDTLLVADFDTAFHVYAAEVSEKDVRVFVDGKEYFRFVNDGKGDPDTWPFDTPKYVILNLAVGGWGGVKGVDDSLFPHQMEVDWVRVFKPREKR